MATVLQGKGELLVNSGSAKKAVLQDIFSVVLLNTECRSLPYAWARKASPKPKGERVKVAHQMLEAAIRAGMKEEDVLFDLLF